MGWWVGVELENQEGYRPQNSGSSMPSPPDQTSDYPVILSLENHCSWEQQEIIVRHLTEILGDQLLTTALDGQPPTQLPSPEVGTLPSSPGFPTGLGSSSQAHLFPSSHPQMDRLAL